MLKKSLSLLFAVVLLFGTVLYTAAAAGTKYKVTSAFANVLPAPDDETRPIAVLSRGDVVYAGETENGFAHITLPSAGLSGWVALTDLAYMGGEAENPQGVVRIYINTPPDKTEYVEGEEAFDPTGLTVWAEYTSGYEAPVTGYALYLPAFTRYGEKEVRVSYTAPGGAVFGTSFKVTVLKVPVEEILIDALPAKTDYIEGEALDLTGLRVRITYADGRPAEELGPDEILADPDFTLMGCHSETQGAKLALGTHVLRLYYKYPELNCAFTVTAKKKTLTSLTVMTPPDSLTAYSRTEAPDLTGLTLAAGYDNGETETITPDRCTVICDPASFVLGSGNVVTVRFGGLDVRLDFTLALDEAVSLSALLPGEHRFLLGEKIDLRNLKVYLHYDSGMQTEVRDYAMSEIDPQMIGSQSVTVTRGEFSALFQITISPYYQKGDVDGDGKVSAYDARLSLRAAVRLTTLAGDPFHAADADGSGEIQAADARKILRAAVKLETLIGFDDLILYPDFGGSQ